MSSTFPSQAVLVSKKQYFFGIKPVPLMLHSSYTSMYIHSGKARSQFLLFLIHFFHRHNVLMACSFILIKFAVYMFIEKQLTFYNCHAMLVLKS